MPELPEVEVVRRGVDSWAVGRSVEQVVVHDARSLRRHAPGPEDFAHRLTGQQLQAPQRRGKFLWVPLAQVPYALMIHLGMSGQVLMQSADTPREKHLKVTLDLGEADVEVAPDQLRFVDQRIFGGMQLSDLVQAPDGRTVPVAAVHIAPDPLEDVVTDEWFFRALRNRRTGLKRGLLDQTLISGVGNIYADEALWMSQLHYARPTATITRRQAALVLESLRTVMLAALDAGGTSFDALYVNVNGASGYFDRSLHAYGQEGQYCSRCLDGGRESVIVREKFMNRSSYLCPQCQRRPR